MALRNNALKHLLSIIGWRNPSIQTSVRCLSISEIVCNKSPTPRGLSRLQRQVANPTDPKNVLDEDEVDRILTKDESFLAQFLQIPATPQRLFLIQPKAKWEPGKKPLTTPELQLEENKTLVETLGWEVVDSAIVKVNSFSNAEIFGSGNTETLKAKIKATPGISGIFVGNNILKPKHAEYFGKTYRLPVYDRYRIVLEIFRRHARTKEAKLQVALAEMPYVQYCFHNVHRSASAGFGTSEAQRQMIIEREKKLNDAIQKLKNNRDLIRRNRKEHQIPSIAIVGYTNCGKTSLIKLLTSDASLVPENKLFATLDVTTHEGCLPNSLKVLFLDTIGFISDIPPELIASFGAVLDEVRYADVIVHLRDISHPDAISQKVAVLQQLQDLKIPSRLIENMIEVFNKVDKVDKMDETLTKLNADSNSIFVSAVKGTGAFELRQRIEEATLHATGYLEKLIRVPQTTGQLQWLYKNANVHEVQADPTDANFLIVAVTITPADFAKFVHEFKTVIARDR